MDRRARVIVLCVSWFMLPTALDAQVETPVPKDQRGRIDAERSGFHDASNIRTVFWNYGMVGDYPADPGGVDLSVFHSVEVPKGSGMNYSDGITPFVLAKIQLRDGTDAYIMETGFRERQATSPHFNHIMRFEPRPGYFQADPSINRARSPAVSNDPRTWPDAWPDKLGDLDDPGWRGSWNGYFGKAIVADQESYMVMDDDFYDAWDYRSDSRDSTRNGLGLRIEVRGFQWSNPQARNVVFWHYDITNESTTDYDDNVIFGLYMDSGVGGSALSCDGIFESDDDNAFFDRTFDEDVINLVYTWDRFGHGKGLRSNCDRTGYLGYAYLETPGNALDAIDNDLDGIRNELRDGGAGVHLTTQGDISAYVAANYDTARFRIAYGPIEGRPAFRAGSWWTGDEDLDWTQEVQDVGSDGVPDTGDLGEGDGEPTPGEPNFDRTDLNESDQIGLTGFKINRIRAGQGNPDQTTDGVVFFTDRDNWPQRLYEQFTDPDPSKRFDPPLASNYNIGFLFASGPFQLKAGKTERFSLALAYGADLTQLRRTVRTVQRIYDANYRFAVPPPKPIVTAETGDGTVRLSWSDISERAADPVTGEFDFEGYRIYRATDPEFQDPIGGSDTEIGNGEPLVSFDIIDGKTGFSEEAEEGQSFYLGDDTGITHTWTDSTVTNGQRYYYAVTAYDYGPGSEENRFFPSENAITVSRTTRGGTILPPNVVEVRPNPPVLGYVPAQASAATHASGAGNGTVAIDVVNSNLVPDDHLFAVTFTAPPDSILARRYVLRDSTAHETLFATGADFAATGAGAVGAGLLPLVRHGQTTVQVDTARTGFTPSSTTNVRLTVTYLTERSIDFRRPGFPNDFSVVFEDVVVDTSLDINPVDPHPIKYRAYAHTPSGDLPLESRIRDQDGDGTLSRTDEFLDLVNFVPGDTVLTWRLRIDPASAGGTIDPPSAGDVFEASLTHPLTAADVFTFRTNGESIDPDAARRGFAAREPYVVPNPYVASASFEPERFAVSGRGERRIEFRGLPAHATIRIYTVTGELVQTLRHDGSDDGFVAWNLRTKDNLDVAPGLYVYHVDGESAGTSIGKFAIIK